MSFSPDANARTVRRFPKVSEAIFPSSAVLGNRQRLRTNMQKELETSSLQFVERNETLFVFKSWFFQDSNIIENEFALNQSNLQISWLSPSRSQKTKPRYSSWYFELTFLWKWPIIAARILTCTDFPPSNAYNSFFWIHMDRHIDFWHGFDSWEPSYLLVRPVWFYKYIYISYIYIIYFQIFRLQLLHIHLKKWWEPRPPGLLPALLRSTSMRWPEVKQLKISCQRIDG